MRLLVPVAAVALLSPQGGCTIREGVRANEQTRDNQLVSQPVTLAQLAPTEGSVLVRFLDGHLLVALDGSRSTVTDTLPGATTADGSIRIHKSGATYILRTDSGDRVVPDLVATDIGFLMSPDDRHVATATGTTAMAGGNPINVQLAIISIADASARVFPLAMDRHWRHRWADDGSAFFHRDSSADTWRRVDLVTGAITEARPPIRTPDRDSSAECSAKGFRLRVDIQGDRQRIVIDPIATQANPEALSGVQPRLLVEAEHLPAGKLRDNPAQLAHLNVMKPCDLFTFDFAGWVYLGEVSSGRFARLFRGSDAR